jgi:gas vesicle protein
MKTSSKFLLTFGAGAAIGAVLGVLFAPAKGSETREKIQDAGKKLNHNIKDVVARRKEQIKSIKESIKEKMEDMEDKIKEII